MPKQRITKEMILDVAFHIAKNQGMDQVLVRNIAKELSCSVQPIYSYYKNIDALKADIIDCTADFFQQYVASHMDEMDLFRSVGHAYIHLAKEEPHLFRLYFLRKRDDITSVKDIYEKECNPNVARHLAKTLGINIKQARDLHLHMAIYTMGISSTLAMGNQNIPEEDILQQLDYACECFLQQIKNGKRKGK